MKNKLRSKNGASLMLAMLFLLFCLLIGGTILAAASANGFRTSRVTDKQAELAESSAASLVANQMDGIATMEIDTKASPVQATLTLKAGVKFSPMHRLAAEMAVCEYLANSGGSSANLVCNGTTIAYSSFWFKPASTSDISGTFQMKGNDLVDKTVGVKMSGYSLAVDVGDHVTVQMKGTYTAQENGNPVISWSTPLIKKEG